MDSNQDLEQQRLDLEKQKIEFERMKLEHEKEKFNSSTGQTKDNSDSLQSEKKINKWELIAVSGVVISVFLPWAEARVSGFGATFSSSASGINSAQGILVLLLSAVSIFLITIKNKYSVAPTIVSILLALSIITGIGGTSMSSFGVSARAGFGLGPVITIAFGVLQIILSFIPFGKSTNVESFDLISFVKKNQFWFILSLTFCFSFYFISLSTYEDFTFLGFLWFLIVTIGVYFIYNYLKLNIVKKVYLIGFLSFFIVNRLIHYFSNPLGVKNTESSFNVNLESSGTVYFQYFTGIFLLFFFTALILDFLKKINKTFLQGKIEDRLLYLLKPTTYGLITGLLLIVPFTYYSFTRTIITSDDKENFIAMNKDLNGKWYYLNEDKTYILEFTISSRSDVYQNEFQDTLNFFIDVWGANPINNEPFQFSTIIRGQYQQKIQTPINLENFISIEKITPEKLVFIFKKQSGSRISAMSNKENLLRISERREENTNESQEENYIGSEENYSEDTATESYTNVVATSKRAYFYNEPNFDSKTPKFIVAGQEAFILENTDEQFVKVSFEYKGKTTIGYLSSDDVSFY